ncbi:hypothetical protein [Microbacterium sp. B19]|uniref:ORC-CDC6 family AAA ATPase n=1 Tax=Microbacterium sp. B19 TaxID=96765 RepID=UPI00034BC87F|nr:hypothetical protein [Microbacterium sp. B19]
MVIHNPFRYRATEQLSQLSNFHRTFGVEMLSLMPTGQSLWDRLVVLRSAPGAGKTSLLRLFSAESLAQLSAYVHPEVSVLALRREITIRGALDAKGLKRLGIFLSMRPDYKALVDLGPNGASASKILFKLLDARIIRTALEAIAFARQVQFPEGLDRVELVFSALDATGSAAIRRLSYATDERLHDGRVPASEVLTRAEEIEKEVLNLLDSLVPVEWDQIDGHTKLYSLDLLDQSRFAVDGVIAALDPLLLIDDVDELHEFQRDAVYDALLDRRIGFARWVAERQAAASSGELIGKTVGRDLLIITVDDGRVVSDTKRHRLLKHIADTRGVEGLSAIDVHSPFSDLLDGDASLEQKGITAALEGSRRAVMEHLRDHPAYQSWFEDIEDRVSGSNSLESAIAFREAFIRLEREHNRAAETLFSAEFDDTVEVELVPESQSKDRGAARLFLSNEYSLPYYYGPETLSALSSRNVEQFLRISGDAFDAMVAAVSRRSRRGNATLSAADQDRLIRRTSYSFWNEIPRRVERGADVLALLTVIAAVSVEQTYRGNAPYAPGVTGTALPYLQRNALLDGFKGKSEIRNRLSAALRIAVAENLLEMSSEIARVKNQDLILFHLNRLLLPALKLPLQRSGFREQSVATLVKRFEAVVRLDLDAARAIGLTPAQIPGWPR